MRVNTQAGQSVAEGHRDTVPGKLIPMRPVTLYFPFPRKDVGDGFRRDSIRRLPGGSSLRGRFKRHLRPTKALTARLYKSHFSQRLNVRLERSPANAVYVHISPPILPQESGEHNQWDMMTESQTAVITRRPPRLRKLVREKLLRQPSGASHEARRRVPTRTICQRG